MGFDKNIVEDFNLIKEKKNVMHKPLRNLLYSTIQWRNKTN